MISKNGVISTKEFLENKSGSTYTITGSLTDNNGEFSGFSAANYITTNASVSANSSKLEVYGSYTTKSDVSTEQYVCCTLTRNLAVTVINGKFRLQVSSNNGSGWNNLIVGTSSVSANTKYYFKIISDNTNIRLYVLINNVWVLQATVAISGTFTTTTFGFGNHLPTKVAPTLGYINIKDYIIKINGITTWTGVDAYLTNDKAKINKNYIGSLDFYES